MFRAFLNYSGKEVERMTIREYMDCCLVLNDVLKIWHAPYLDHNK